MPTMTSVALTTANACAPTLSLSTSADVVLITETTSSPGAILIVTSAAHGTELEPCDLAGKTVAGAELHRNLCNVVDVAISLLFRQRRRLIALHSLVALGRFRLVILSRRQATASSELRGNDCIYAHDRTWSSQPVTGELASDACERLAAQCLQQPHDCH